jgi:Flp pilus assembly protein TadG
MRRISLRSGLADEGGATAVELALVLPMLVTFILGIWYLGWSLNLGGEVRHAVEMGSRIYITNPSATSTDLSTAVSSHLTDVQVSAIALTTSSQTVGTTTSQHITWSFSTTPPIPFVSSIPITFTGSYDVPAATP